MQTSIREKVNAPLTFYQKVALAHDMLSILDDTNVKAIITLLEMRPDREFSVTEIFCSCRMGQSYTSHGLKLLRKYKYVIWRKEGKNVFYKYNPETVEKVNKALKNFLTKKNK